MGRQRKGATRRPSWLYEEFGTDVTTSAGAIVCRASRKLTPNAAGLEDGCALFVQRLDVGANSGYGRARWPRACRPRSYSAAIPCRSQCRTGSRRAAVMARARPYTSVLGLAGPRTPSRPSALPAARMDTTRSSARVRAAGRHRQGRSPPDTRGARRHHRASAPGSATGPMAGCRRSYPRTLRRPSHNRRQRSPSFLEPGSCLAGVLGRWRCPAVRRKGHSVRFPQNLAQPAAVPFLDRPFRQLAHLATHGDDALVPNAHDRFRAVAQPK